jgi:chromosomal replication initiation ATPase DnaA
MNNYLTKKIRQDKIKRQQIHGRNVFAMARVENINAIGEKVLKYFPGLTLEEMKLEKRFQELFIPRQLWMYFSVMCFDYSNQMVARVAGERNHSSVYNAIRKLENLCDVSTHYSERVEKIFFNEIIIDELCVLEKSDYIEDFVSNFPNVDGKL